MTDFDPSRPLAAAAERLRRRPGRPRKTPAGPAGEIPIPDGDHAGRSRTHPTMVPARLLDLGATAGYLGVSAWTVRDLEAAGTLRRVRVPLPNHGELRKLLFDRIDLDRLIEAWKDGPGHLSR